MRTKLCEFDAIRDDGETVRLSGWQTYNMHQTIGSQMHHAVEGLKELEDADGSRVSYVSAGLYEDHEGRTLRSNSPLAP